MSVRVVRWVLATIVGLMSAHAAADTPETGVFETPLTNLVTAIDEILVDPESGDAVLSFAISPVATPVDGRLVLGLEPLGPDAPALIVVVNNSRAVRIAASDEPISAEIELPGRVLNPGTNIVTLALEDDETTGWRLDGAHSRLRVSYTLDRELETLGDIEAALAADVPQPGSIFIADRANDVMVEAVTAQGIALRMGRVPEFVTDPANAGLRVSYDLDAELSGAEIRFESGGIVLAGRHQQDLESAARLFASRSMRQADTIFTVADALHSGAIGRENTREESSQATLREFTEARLPFGEGRGAETAVILTDGDSDRRLAGLSIMARTALAHQTAWIYAWYGNNSQSAPENRHIVFVGTGALADRQLLNGAPVEFRTALRQAADHSGRSGLRLSSAAYANEGVPPSGVATVFTDPDNPTRWIAGFTSPEPSGFNRASEILSRSAHWGALTGRAAIWDEDGVTGYDYSVEGTPTLAQRYGLPDLSMREIAFVLFILTMLFILRGIWRRRRVNDKSRGWR